MSHSPLVSIICLCYNHERFLKDALDSVLAQTYQNLEIVVVDDMSTDNSAHIISEYLEQYPNIKMISTGQNLGNCAAFNMGFKASSGEYIIDFATDDVLLPERVSLQIAAFRELDRSYGVVYTDAACISDGGSHLYYHSERYKPAPDGNVFAEVLGRYFICPPTMLIRRQVLEELNGYDSSLAYEDFDFWIRSSKICKYFYLDKVTTQRRLHDNSLSSGLYKKGNRLLQSTVRVCEKAAELVQTKEEMRALKKRLTYEARHAYLTGNHEEAKQLLDLLRTNGCMPTIYGFLYMLNENEVKLSFFRKLYLLARSK